MTHFPQPHPQSSVARPEGQQHVREPELREGIKPQRHHMDRQEDEEDRGGRACVLIPGLPYVGPVGAFRGRCSELELISEGRLV